MANWRECMHAQVRDLRISGTITFGSGTSRTLTGEDIATLTINEGSDGMLAPGSVLSAECALDLVNDEGQWQPGGSCLGSQELIGATVQLRIGVVSGTETLWRGLGCFQICTAAVHETEACVKLKCTDSIAMELADFFEDHTLYPATLQQIWDNLIEQTRYVFSGNIPNGSAVIDSAPEWNGATLREAMGRIAEAAGCFVQLDRSGNLTLKRVWDADAPAYAIGSDAYMKLERDLLSYGPLDALKLTPAGADAQQRIYYSGTSHTALFVQEITNNPLFIMNGAHLDALAQGELNCVSGFQTQQLRFDWRGDPELRIGDRIELTDASGSAYTAVLSGQTLRYETGFSAGCTCTVPSDADSGVRRAVTPEGGLNASRLVGAIDGKLLSAGSVTTNKLAAGSVTAEKVAAGAVEAKLLSAVNAVIENLEAGSGTFDNLDAAFAKMQTLIAGSAEFDRATVAHLIAEAMNLEFGVGDDVFIGNLRVAFAQMVSASIGNLCIKASNGSYYSIDVNQNGNVTATLTQVTEEEKEAGETTGGRTILDTNITAASLSTSSLLATYALINKIDASRIDVDTLMARQAFIDALYTSRIFGGESLEMIAGKAAAANSKVDNLRIGARNYIRDSRSLPDVIPNAAYDNDIARIANIVRSNTLETNEKVFPIGHRIIIPWKDMDDGNHNTDATAYQVEWDIAHHGMVTLQNGSQVPGMFLQMHKCSAYGVQFSNYQAFMNCPDGLAAGTYNVIFGATWGSKDARAGTQWQFTLTRAVPAGGRLSGFEGMPDQVSANWRVKSWSGPAAASPIETVTVTAGSGGTNLGTMNLATLSDDGLNCMQRVGYGHNRWATSAIRQYLNAAGQNWFSSKEDFDIRPNEYAKHGFMSGFNSDFLNAIKPVKVTTALNTAEGYTETTEDTFDTFFLPSLQQMNVNPQLANAEGDAFDYWKRALGSQNFVGTGSANVFDAFKIPAINNNSAQHVRLRSAARGGAHAAWYVNSSGYVNYNLATGARCFSPVCVIC